jgi:hypothetical protein
LCNVKNEVVLLFNASEARVQLLKAGFSIKQLTEVNEAEIEQRPLEIRRT